jgi:hypothetical protein
MSAAARRVLVMDVPVLAAIFSRRLGTTGLTVLTDPAAIGGDERLACALLDLATGGLGIAAALLVRQPELRVAFLTSGADAATLEAAGEIGTIFVKPSGMREALEWVRSAAAAADRHGR